ncbi:acyl-CoA thioesterase [Halosegnis sp.]|uniref:acyl-CoA thioesterase n=1 Tax=Halosegnis sp. TaxID=2864959 RepID=UPI0035D45D05
MDDAFRFREEIPLRLRDLDQMNHVNNAVYATFLEQTRSAYFREVVGAPLEEIGAVIADLAIEFEQAITLDAGHVTVGARATDLGDSSVPLVYEVWADGERAATGETTLVYVDRTSGEVRSLPDSWRAAITDFEEFDDRT